jgi:hypothetical protein
MEILPFSFDRQEAVDRFNARLAAAGSEWTFPAPERPPDAGERPVWTESYVAVEDGEVYGGYILKHQRFVLEGRRIDVGSLQLPLSLGEVDEAYGRVSVALLFDAIRRRPYLYSLGLGSEDSQFARLLAAAEWQHVAVPFYFKVLSANRFAREVRLPPDRARVQQALRALGHARLAAAAFALRRAIGRRGSAPAADRPAPASARLVTSFDDVADDVFASCAPEYRLIAERTSAVLREVFPREEPRYLRLVVERGGSPIGWALVLDTRMRDAKYFGDMRVGSIADCLAQPDDATAVVAAASEHLAHRGVDLIVSNQLDARWGAALAADGYERGPSNFFFYFSPEFGEQLTADGWEARTHLNRGDGEGPAHL